MTLKEAIMILPTIKEYFSIFDIDTERITLDGTFTLTELESIITIFRNKDQIYLIDKDL